MACAGLGALGSGEGRADRQAAQGAQAAMSLVNRSLLIWLVAIALLTAVGAAA